MRSYVKVGRRAEYTGRYTKVINPTDTPEQPAPEQPTDHVRNVSYTVKVNDSNLSQLPGDLRIDHTESSGVTTLRFHPNDINGNVLRPILMGDIIELDLTRTGSELTNATVRYIAQSNQTRELPVQFVGGALTLAEGDTAVVRFIPQGHSAAKLFSSYNSWAPSLFSWEFDGYTEDRVQPDDGKFQIAYGGKDFLCFSAVMANGLKTGGTFGTLDTYEGHQDRLCLWHYIKSKDTWKVFFDGLVSKWDGGTNMWYAEMDPISYGTKTRFENGNYFVTGGPF